MRGRALAAALLLAASCSKPKPAPPPPDAGQLVRRASDLRTAILAALPEFREIRITSGSAVLRRTLIGEAKAWKEDAVKALAQGGWKEEPRLETERVLSATRDSLRLEIAPQPRGFEQRISLVLRDGDPGRVLGAPISLTTEQLALYFPKLEGTVPSAERFEVTLEYETTPERAHFLVWQLVDVSTRGQWKLLRVPEGFEVARRDDGGIGAVPEKVSLVLEDGSSQARVSVDRDGKKVRVEYELETLELR